jgi:polyvinyl alcohol dehydrogenase (cytochrome)
MNTRSWITASFVAVALLASACSGGGGASIETPTAPPSAADSWPMLGHDLSSSFHSTASTLLAAASASGLSEAWQIRTSGAVTGTAAIADGRAYVLASGAMYAINIETGETVWQNANIKGTSSPTYVDGKVYVNDNRSVLHALDAATGAELWNSKIDPHPAASGFSSPIVAGNRVIVGSASIEEVSAKDNASFRGSIVAFDRTSGAEIWRHYTVEPPQNGVSVWSTASVDEDAGLVFGTTGNNYTGDASDTSDSIFAVELETGKLRWNRQVSANDVFTIPAPKSPDSDFGTNPILFDATIAGVNRKLVGAGQKSGMFWVLDRISGEIVWSRKVSGGSALIGGIFNNGAFDGQRIIVAGNNGTSTGAGSEPANGNSKPLGGANVLTSVLAALDPADGRVLWERQLPAWVWAPITLAGGIGFVAADRELQAFDAVTGARLWSIQTDGTIASGAAIAGDRVIFGSGIPYLGTKTDNTLHALALP